MDLLHVLWLAFLAGLRGQGPACRPGQWECDDGNCISADWRCDADGDCLDGSDETDCQKPAPVPCPAGQFACVDSAGCVNESGRCDGVRQCPTGSDEEDCAPRGGCLEADWRCLNAMCVPKEGRCDGNDDCLDGSDERDCGLCAEGWLKCPEGRCVSPEQRCDETRHCSDGSDEPESCGNVCWVDNGSCSHVCVDQPWGVLCLCPPGLKLSLNGLVCEDLDECSQPFPPCTQHCTNTVGSFYCHCREGFVLDQSACLASGGATRLLTVQNRSLGLVGLDGQPFEMLWTADSEPLAVAFDLGRGWYYWADSQGSIYKTDGKKTNTLYSGQPGVTSLACNWLNGDLYWTNRKTRSIYMGSADGSGFTTLLSKSINPTEMVVLPMESMMFWINVGPGERTTLDCSWMDGAERRPLVVLTTQAAHGLTVDVASRRLYWISDFKNSAETVRVDGTGRYTVPGLLGSRPTAALAVFGNRFYWMDRRGLWQADQNQTNKKSLLQKTAASFMTVFHELQQPKGSSACTNSPCQLCLLTKTNPLGFTCSCPDSKILMPDRRCDYPRFVYATVASVNMLEFKEGEVIQTQLFTTQGILTYDVDWYRDGLYWANRTGQIQHTSLTQRKTQPVPTLLPVCLIKLDQRSGVVFWVSCDQATIGIAAAFRGYPRELYHTKGGGIKDMYVDWLRGKVYWLEGSRLLSMAVQGGPAKELLNLTSGFTGTVALDLRANALLWNTQSAGLSTLSLLQKRTHGYGTRWNITGSVVAAFEPYLLSLSDDTMTLWDRRDGRSLKALTPSGRVFGVMVALKDMRPVPDQPVCPEPTVLCPGSSMCLNPGQLCDGKEDCPNGFDENPCIKSCPLNEDFRCKDRRSCVSRDLVCDGRAHCHDGSDELGCPTVVTAAPQTNSLRCRKGSKACGDGRQCVLYSHVCDGEPDCDDGSDEEGCETYSPLEPALSPSYKPLTAAVPQEVTGLPAPPSPTQAPCSSPAVQCPDSDMCIPHTQLCDGRKDCPDGSDEGSCVKRCPNQNDFRCKDRRSCVSRDLVCDGRAHCHDGSDELGCPTVASAAPQTNGLRCRKGSKACGDGRQCVLYSHVCDGEPDCEDGSDERDCSNQIALTQVLSISQSPSPESSSPVAVATEAATSVVCPPPSLPCPASSTCIAVTQFCDGKVDCPDGSDEMCVDKCPQKTDFRCKDRRSCVSRSLVCDGRAHCHDGSDELGCPTVATAAPQTNGLGCRKGSMACGDGRQCVLYSRMCDGEPDCEDGSDEERCEEYSVPPLEPALSLSYKPLTAAVPQEVTGLPAPPSPTQAPCSSPAVQCPDSDMCIPHTQLCDGRKDCPDGSDESSCVKRCPNQNDFRCKDRRSCVSRDLVCDGRAHCHDGSDELGCPTVAPAAPQTNGLRCRLGSRPCGDGKQCVLFTHVCDGESDCEDGSDERDCSNQIALTPVLSVSQSPSPESSSPVAIATEAATSVVCPPPSLPCPASSTCIPVTQFCDGKVDCPDGSDELRCPTVVTAAPQTNGLRCRKGSKACGDGRQCVLYSHVCDGEPDCEDGSDENGCPPACSEGQFQCADRRRCLPRAQVCDGRPQCLDQSDESDCWKPSRSCQHRCDDNKRCLPATFLCDGEQDCRDGSDEDGCDSSASNPSEPPGPPPEPPRPPASPQAGCPSPRLLCAGSSLCLFEKQICDGRRDCPDGADEKNCVTRCQEPEFLCRDGSGCLPSWLLCDGHAHCADASDEQCAARDPSASYRGPSPRAAPLRCRKGSRPCRGGGECVLYSHVCDGEADCADGSDEEDCSAHCKEKFQCAQGNRCIPLDQVCDGQSQCQDRSDEADCPVLMEGCRHRCDNDTRCVPETFLCDGERDCADGSDETKCARQQCSIAQFRCSSGQCVSDALRCDGYPDCRDRSDEAGCARPPRCPLDLRCPHGHECLQKEWLCDGEEDCPDGWDEKNCTFAAAKCREFQWQCGDGSQCVPLTWRCDGRKDCHNAADEDQCGAATCPAPMFQCGSAECLDAALVCNGITNCADGSDEGPGCLQQNCSSPAAPRCDRRCVSTPHGARCYCPAGFKLHASGVSCVDEDECNRGDAVCQHSCLNAPGSYFCRCRPGFLLEPDQTSCKPTEEASLLASVQSELLVVGLHTAQIKLLSWATRPVFSLDYDWQQQRVYWLSPDYQSVRWAHLSDPNNKGTLVKGLRSDFLAVDWVGRNLYWVDGLLAQIVAVPLVDYLVRPQNYTVVLDEDLEQPSSLVLLPHRGLMVWSEIGSAPEIEQAGMDGSNRRVLVNKSLSWPASLTFDLLGDRLYWVDEKLRCIGSASLDGENLKILQLDETPSPFSVAVFNDRVFWSDTKRRTIRSAHKLTGKDQKILLKRPGQPFGLKLMHPLSQPALTSPCDKTSCSHICLLGPARSGELPPRGPTAVCRCPPGLFLTKNRVTCSTPSDSAFILLLTPTFITQVFLRSLQNGVSLKTLPSSHRVLSIPGVGRATTLDADIPMRSVYLADGDRGSLVLLKLSSSRSKQALTTAGTILSLKGDDVAALAVDWVTSNVYWSSSNLPDLHLTSINGAYTTSLLQGLLKGCTSIAVHPPSGRLCYSAVGVSRRSASQVDCAYMDGRKRVVLWKKSNVPASLVFNNDGKRIFWADIGEGVVVSMAVDGTGYRAYQTGPGLLTVFTSVDNMLLWVTFNQGTSRLWISDGVQPRQLWFQMRSSLRSLKAYSRTSQMGGNGCSMNNGGCAQLCLAHPDGRTCRCGRDFRVANVTSCVAFPPCEPGSESCGGRDDAESWAGVGGAIAAVPAVQKNLTACDVAHCSGHGRCSDAACDCNDGYSGEFCQVVAGGSHAPAVMATLCVLAAVVTAAAVYKKRGAWRLVKRRSLEKETLMTNMGIALPDGFYDADTEDLDSPTDPVTALNPTPEEPARTQSEPK